MLKSMKAFGLAGRFVNLLNEWCHEYGKSLREVPAVDSDRKHPE